MFFDLRKFLSSGQVQLNIIGVALIILLGLSAWNIARSLTWAAAIPLAFIAYAAWRVIYELTWNRKNVPTLATSVAGRGKITEILKHDAGKRGNDYTVIDLGSGRGELTRHIARALPQARVIGIERSRIPFWQSVFIQRMMRWKNIAYQRGDFLTYDCSRADAVVFFLSPGMMPRVSDKLLRELKPGSIVISHIFPLPDGWTQLAAIEFRTPFKEAIYVYRRP